MAFLKFSQPVVKELDISGIQSPYAVLMQANSGKILALREQKKEFILRL